MKVATWKDGTESIRRTHTRDYKFAFKAIDMNGNTEIGFSTSRRSAESNARRAINWSLTTQRNIAKSRGGVYAFNNSEKGKQIIEETKKCLENIEIVEIKDL